jgi:hypothetical protein
MHSTHNPQIEGLNTTTDAGRDKIENSAERILLNVQLLVCIGRSITPPKMTTWAHLHMLTKLLPQTD